MGAASVDVFQQVGAGDHVLFNDRKAPLTVETVEDGDVQVSGPKGGEYVLYRAADKQDLILVSKPGNWEYASKVVDLRIVGQWERIDDTRWEHTRSGAAVAVVRNELGYWSIVFDAFDGETPDVPKYGFTEKSAAIDEALKFVREQPEG